ncbi:MAG: hypothetical protein WBG93_15175, partial [Thermoanaerobaculia bacterium]
GVRHHWMSSVKAIWSSHLGRAVLVALLVALVFLVVRVAGLRPAGALDILFHSLLDETDLGVPLEKFPFFVSVIVVGLLEIPLTVLVGAIVGLFCRFSGYSVTATGWATGVIVASAYLPISLLAMPVP